MSTASDELRKKIIQFQKDTLEEWSNPYGRNVDMIRLAHSFADGLESERQQTALEALELFHKYIDSIPPVVLEDVTWWSCRVVYELLEGIEEQLRKQQNQEKNQ